MSRIGNAPVDLKDGVSATSADGVLKIKGPKGELSLDLDKNLGIDIKDGSIVVIRKSEDKYVKSIHGTTRAIVSNMVIGVTEGWSKQLEMVGTGYRAEVNGKDLVMSIGFSHPVTITPPEGIDFKVEKNLITVSGPDKEVVGQVSANVRKVRPPEPYKGKGIKYIDEFVRRKPGKAAKASESA